MIKIALINPYTPDGNIVPPLGLLTLAAILESSGHEVAAFDESIDSKVISSIVDFKPDIIGISAVTSAVLSGRDLVNRLRNEFPGVTVVFGGPHPSAMPLEVISWPETDFVIAGEAEKSMQMLADWSNNHGTQGQLEKIPNLYYKTGTSVRYTYTAKFLTSEELNNLPLPAYHLMDIDRIASRIRHGLFRKGKRVLPYMATRGCPHKCTFCCRMMGSQVRRKQPNRVLDDIEGMVSRYDIDEIYMEDDNFTSSKPYALHILNGIIERQLPISLKFANGLRIDSLSEALLEKMRAIGCHSLGFGLESGSQKVLKLMQKNLDLTEVRNNVNKVKSFGFLVGANMILGYPGEIEEDIWDSFNFFKSLNLDSVAVVNLVPFPGTYVRKICEENGYLTEQAYSWNNYYFDIKNPKILIETENLRVEQLQKIMKKIFFKLYTDKKRIKTLLKNMTLEDIKDGVKIMIRKAIN